MHIAYLLGLPRSGTTLLSALLNQHPQIYCPPEPWLMLALSSLGTVPVTDPAGSDLVYHASAPYISNPELHHDLAMRIYASLMGDKPASLLIDKTPRYHHCLQYIAATMPGARYLWIVRNPLDVAASYKTTWNIDIAQALRNHSDDVAMFDFALGFRRLCKFSKSQDLHLIRYEDLVSETQGSMDSVFNYLGLEPFALDQDITGGLQPLASSAFGDTKIAGTTGVHGNSVDRYSETLSEDDAQTICSYLGRELLHELGYPELYDKHQAALVEGAADLPSLIQEDAESLIENRRMMSLEPYRGAVSPVAAADPGQGVAAQEFATLTLEVAELRQVSSSYDARLSDIDALLARMAETQSLEKTQNEHHRLSETQGRKELEQAIEQAAAALAELKAYTETEHGNQAKALAEIKSELAPLRQSILAEVEESQRELLAGLAERLTAESEAQFVKVRRQLEISETEIARIRSSLLMRLFTRNGSTGAGQQ